ncbi:MAG: tetraacyldisaccharide 4'-kinase, partial [Fusobacteria bacterium]|nr:tetraacyldisaccharide 4'-kinase [Fusobacteriota bacterium]
MLVLSWLYAMITTVRNFLYDSKILNSEKVEGVEVICIGNITVGGTGKTPIVQYFAKKYINEGKKVAIVSRGYKGKRSVDPLIVSNYENIIATVEESGDEPYLHAIALPKIPVIVARKRIEGVKLAKKEFQVDVVILDDGFQHRQLYR